MAVSEIKVKKPKKGKKNKGTRKRQVDEDDIFPAVESNSKEDSMDIDSKEAAPKKKRKTADEDFVDDDDLQASLAAQRRSALKKRKKTRPEDIAKQLREQQDEEDQQNANGDQDGGLVIGEISEFVAGLGKPEEEDERKPRKRRTTTRSPGLEEDHDMADVGTNDAYNPTQDEADLLDAATHEQAEPTVDEEKTVGQGMGAALSLLRERGLVSSDNTNSAAFQAHRDRSDFLLQKRLLEAELDEQTRQQRERDRRSGKLDRMSQREREEYARQENHRRDLQQSRRMNELFAKTYKPSVEIKYHDESGRELDRKEAFKEMSHQFHGKGSGKGKTEKMLKKIEDEKRREGQSLFDASGAGMSAATQQQVKKRREAGVRLQ